MKICIIDYLLLLDVCLLHIYTQLHSQFILLRPHIGHPLVIAILGLHLHSEKCDSFPS